MRYFVTAMLAALLMASCGDTKSGAPPPKPEIDIWTAASQGAVGIVKQHIAYGTDINSTFILEGVPGTGGSPLHIACLTRQHEVMKLLIESGANLEQKAVYPDPGGGTPLHWAIFVVDSVAVEALLDAGVNVNSRDRNGATPLDYTLIDFGTLSAIDPAYLPPERQRIYDLLTQKGGRRMQ